MLHPLHPLFALLIFASAFVSLFLLKKLVQTDAPKKHNNEPIDGLRGFLAWGVFVHHACIWYTYLHEDVWQAPKVYLFNQLGSACVALFFMITGYLFTDKLQRQKRQTLDWQTLFRSRIFRLCPAYFASMIAVFVLAIYKTGGSIVVPAKQFLLSVFHYAAFCLADQPGINGYDKSWMVNAGVVWSLSPEWLFYLMLPLLGAIFFRQKFNLIAVIPGMMLLAFFLKVGKMEWSFLFGFAAGAIAAIASKHAPIKHFAAGKFASVAAIACLVAAFTLFPDVKNNWCKVLLSLAFIIIACGNNLFSALKSETLKAMGHVSYSTYLFHGIVLFTLFEVVLDVQSARAFSPLQYCAVIIGVTPLVALVSVLSYRFVELPFMRRFAKRKR